MTNDTITILHSFVAKIQNLRYEKKNGTLC